MRKLCAPQQSAASRASGRDSRVGAAAAAARALADRFAGLPEEITRWRLAAALRVAAPRLGLTPSMLALLAHYIDLTYDADWKAGSEPVIGRPVVEIAEALGRSERQIRNLERALMERGLLSWRDSGNQQRRASRSRDGKLVYAYGPTLAPLGTRARELIATAEACRAEQAEARRLRMAVAALQRRLRNDLDSLPARTAAEFETRLAELSPRNSAKTSLDALRERRDALTALSLEIRDVLPAADGVCDSDVLPEIPSRPLPDTKTKNCTPVAAIDRPLSPRTVHAAAGEVFRSLCDDRDLSWPALTEAARLSTSMLGLSQDDWAEACDALGRCGAATAIVLIERNMQRGPNSAHPSVRHPRAYLKALGRRRREGKLALEKSIRAIVAREHGLQGTGCRSGSIGPSR